MPHDIPTVEPTELYAGDSWEWDHSSADFKPSDGWSLKYELRGRADKTFTATASGETFQVRESPATTATVTPDAYRLYRVFTKGTDRHTIYAGTLDVRADPATTVNAQTKAASDLALVDAAISGRLTADEEQFTINGRQVSKIPIEELYRIQRRLRQEVWMQRNPGKALPRGEVKFSAVA